MVICHTIYYPTWVGPITTPGTTQRPTVWVAYLPPHPQPGFWKDRDRLLITFPSPKLWCCCEQCLPTWTLQTPCQAHRLAQAFTLLGTQLPLPATTVCVLLPVTVPVCGVSPGPFMGRRGGEADKLFDLGMPGLWTPWDPAGAGILERKQTLANYLVETLPHYRDKQTGLMIVVLLPPTTCLPFIGWRRTNRH